MRVEIGGVVTKREMGNRIYNGSLNWIPEIFYVNRRYIFICVLIQSLVVLFSLQPHPAFAQQMFEGTESSDHGDVRVCRDLSDYVDGGV